jgi:hypothetical protein
MGLAEAERLRLWQKDGYRPYRRRGLERESCSAAVPEESAAACPAPQARCFLFETVDVCGRGRDQVCLDASLI